MSSAALQNFSAEFQIAIDERLRQFATRVRALRDRLEKKSLDNLHALFRFLWILHSAELGKLCLGIDEKVHAEGKVADAAIRVLHVAEVLVESSARLLEVLGSLRSAASANVFTCGVENLFGRRIMASFCDRVLHQILGSTFVCLEKDTALFCSLTGIQLNLFQSALFLQPRTSGLVSLNSSEDPFFLWITTSLANTAARVTIM